MRLKICVGASLAVLNQTFYVLLLCLVVVLFLLLLSLWSTFFFFVVFKCALDISDFLSDPMPSNIKSGFANTEVIPVLFYKSFMCY